MHSSLGLDGGLALDEGRLGMCGIHDCNVGRYQVARKVKMMFDGVIKRPSKGMDGSRTSRGSESTSIYKERSNVDHQ